MAAPPLVPLRQAPMRTGGGRFRPIPTDSGEFSAEQQRRGAEISARANNCRSPGRVQAGLSTLVKYPLELEEKIAKLKLEATEAFRRKEYLKAAELYTCAMKLEDRVKEYAILLANRSFCCLRLGQGEDAVSDATKCTKFRPHWPKGYYRQGAAYMLLKDYEKACEAFEDGLKLDHTNVDIKNALREAQEALKNADWVGK